MRRQLGSVLAIAFVAFVATAACGQKNNAAGTGADTTAAAAAQPAPAPSAAATATPAAGGAAPAAATIPPNLPAGVTADMINQGNQIFHGQLAGGTCYTCHGPDAKGTSLAPDLTATTHLWVTDYPSYVALITKGVPTPKQHPAPMPAMGGATLTPDQVKAVAAYEWSLSHPQGGK